MIRLREITFVVACYAVHASVYASQPNLWVSLQDNAVFMEAVINMMSAICASMANTAFRLKRADVVVEKVLVELISGVGVGFVAGLITYSVTESMSTDVFLQLALVTLSGWGGSKVIETYTEKYFGGGKAK